MTVNITALIPGNHSALAVAAMISTLYGGTRFSARPSGSAERPEFFHQVLTFNERHADDENFTIRSIDRQVGAQRKVHIFVDDYASVDYEDVTDTPCTMVMFGHSGDAKLITHMLAKAHNGWVKDDSTTQTWEPAATLAE